MTGMGLMFTLLAILIGRSELHANGSEIDGIQELINGLSGKFVTSIVGLACANAFTLLEHSLWQRWTTDTGSASPSWTKCFLRKQPTNMLKFPHRRTVLPLT